ncbi:D-alanine--D-alanine ligase [Planctomycetota bacterium]|nr:D-alanine--D-alanine ligase [Planctomycetota bacterium]
MNPLADRQLNIIVLAGGPDAEREVSLMSGEQVAAALTTAGHNVQIHDITPDDHSAIDAFHQTSCDLIFPILHGKWGEGGELQHLLESHNIPFVGSTALASRICMDKQQTKLILQDQNIPTPTFQVLRESDPSTLTVPVVVKPVDEGSSIDLFICRTQHELDEARHLLHKKHTRLMVEQFIQGRELTVGIIPSPQNPTQYQPLPILEIKPATEFYDYQAKYIRDDTVYTFDTGLTPQLSSEIQNLAQRAHLELGARHFSRVDFIFAGDGTPYILEINTIPGCTTHSLLPMAANHFGLPFPQLTNLLAQTALHQLV